jgi:NADH:ubiquinone oxidoreductase subunit 6 (subunit J)
MKKELKILLFVFVFLIVLISVNLEMSGSDFNNTIGGQSSSSKTLGKKIFAWFMIFIGLGLIGFVIMRKFITEKNINSNSEISKDSQSG